MMFTMEERTDLVEFEYNGKRYSMTADEIEAAYRYQERQYRLEDARRQLDIFVFCSDDGYDPDCSEEIEEEKAHFLQEYGLTYEKASAPDMLESYVRQFEDCFDCNSDENSAWENAIRNVLFGMNL